MRNKEALFERVFSDRIVYKGERKRDGLKIIL